MYKAIPKLTNESKALVREVWGSLEVNAPASPWVGMERRLYSLAQAVLALNVKEHLGLEFRPRDTLRAVEVLIPSLDAYDPSPRWGRRYDAHRWVYVALERGFAGLTGGLAACGVWTPETVECDPEILEELTTAFSHHTDGVEPPRHWLSGLASEIETSMEAFQRRVCWDYAKTYGPYMTAYKGFTFA